MNGMKAFAAALMASTALIGTQAAAQTAPPASDKATPPATTVTPTDEGSADIVVTAFKRADRLMDTPLSITAATGDQLQRAGVTDPSMLDKIVPGFVFTKSAYSAPVYTIRGVGSYDEAIGISPTVSVYVDQVPLPFSRMTPGASLDLERVEVLKGPQGTLFGQNSTGGAINYIAAKPTDNFQAGGELTFGRFNEADVSGFISGPITDGVTARLAVRSEMRGDWQKSYTRADELGERNFTTGRFLLDLKPTSNLTFEFSASGWIDKSDTQAKRKIGYSPINPATPFLDSPGFPTLQADLQAYPNAPAGNARAADWDSGLNLKRDDSFYQFSLRGDLRLSDNITLTSISAYSHLKVFSPNDNDGTALPDSSIIVGGWIKSFSQEVRLSGEFGGPHKVKWMIGGNYEYDHTNDTQFLFLRATNTGLRLPPFVGGTFRWTAINNLNDQRINTKAAFGSLDINLTKQLTLQGSVRYTTQDRDFTGCLADSGNGELSRAFSALSTLLSGTPTTIPLGGCVTLDPTTNKPLANGVMTSLDQNNWSWRGGLSWKPSEDVLLYANVTKGYKAGSYGTLPAIRPIQAAPVTQESILAYEAGFKISALNRKIQISGAAYYYDYKDKQLLGSVNLGQPFGTLPALVSVPKSRIAGAELDATFRPTRGLTMRLTGTYTDSRVLGSYVLSDPLPALHPTGVNIGGMAFPNTPKWQGSADIEYRAPISSAWSAFGGGNLNYRSSTRSFFGGDDHFILPEYALLDLRAGFERQDGSLRVMFWGRNVTNKFYKTFVSRATDTIFENAGMPVTYGVTISTKFK